VLIYGKKTINRLISGRCFRRSRQSESRCQRCS